ncbi:hypothetical protein CSPX01_03311 [Colletotrichum filicis]|nr:hypothetical protein CSPX01_03311 [Colletotrichum filicis]
MSCKTSRKTKARLRGVKKLRKQSQNTARYFKPFRFLLASRDTHPVAELFQTCKKIRHETSFMLYNSNAFGFEDVPTLILWLETIGPANRTVLRSLMIEGDCCYGQASITSWLDPLHIYDPSPSFLMAPFRDPYRELTARIGDLLSESMLLEALCLPCGYSFWRLPVLTLRRRDPYPVPWPTHIARRIAETLFKDFQGFFEKRLLFDADTEKLSNVIKVNVICRKDRNKTWSPARSLSGPVVAIVHPINAHHELKVQIELVVVRKANPAAFEFKFEVSKR